MNAGDKNPLPHANSGVWDHYGKWVSAGSVAVDSPKIPVPPPNPETLTIQLNNILARLYRSEDQLDGILTTFSGDPCVQTSHIGAQGFPLDGCVDKIIEVLTNIEDKVTALQNRIG